MQPHDLGSACRGAAEAQPGFDHGLRAAADEGVQLGHRHGRKPDQPQRVVGGGGKVRRGVDDGAVEVEDDGGIGELERHDRRDRK